MIKKTVILWILFTIILLIQLLFYYLSEEIRLPLIVATLLALILLWRKPIFIPKIFTILYLLLISPSFFSSFANGVKFQTILEVTKLFSFLILTIFAINIGREDEKIFPKIFFLLSTASSFLALLGILEFTSRVYVQKTLALIEPFHWPTLSASFFLLVTPTTLSLFLLPEVNNLKKIILFINLSLLLIAWILSKTYLSLLLGTIFGVGIFYFLAFKKSASSLQLKTSVRNISLLLLLILVLIPNLFSSFGENRIPNELSYHLFRYFFQDKDDIARFSWESIQTDLATGVGLGNFGSFYKTKMVKPWVWSNFAENELLQTLVETGVLGLIFQLLLFSYLFTIFLKKWIFSLKKRCLFSFAVSLSATLFLLANFTNSSMRIFPLTLIFYFFVAYLLVGEDMKEVSQRFALLIIIPGVLFSLLLFTDGISLTLGQRYLVWGKYKESELIFRWLTQRPKFLVNPKVYVWLAALSAEQNKIALAKECLAKAKMIDNYNEEIDYQIAYFYYKEGNLDEAIKILEENIYYNPFSPPKFYNTLAKIYAEKNKLALSLYWLKRASLIFSTDREKEFPSFTLSLLDQNNYLPSLRSIYYSLYETLHDKQYLNLFANLIY